MTTPSFSFVTTAIVSWQFGETCNSQEFSSIAASAEQQAEYRRGVERTAYGMASRIRKNGGVAKVVVTVRTVPCG